jgi:hypothetical protein
MGDKWETVKDTLLNEHDYSDVAPIPKKINPPGKDVALRETAKHKDWKSFDSVLGAKGNKWSKSKRKKTARKR